MKIPKNISPFEKLIQWTATKASLPFLLAAILSVFSLIIYYHSLHGGFIFDDWYVIVYNPVIKQPGLFLQIFTGHLFDSYESPQGFQLAYYRPLTLLSLLIDYRIWGLDPAGFRLTNILFHLSNALLLYFLVLKLFKRRHIGLLAAVLFFILPVHEWTVNHIIGRCDLLEVFFLFLSAIYITDSIDGGHKKYLWLSVICFVCSILSREVGLIFVLLAGLICLYRKKTFQETLWILTPFIVIAIVYLAGRMILFPIASESYLRKFTLLGAMDWVTISREYFGRFIFPWITKSYLPAQWDLALETSRVLIGTAILASFIFLKRFVYLRREYFFGVMWVAICFLPLIFLKEIILRLGPYLSEYLLYLPAAGFAIGLSVFLTALPVIGRSILIAGCVIFYAFISFGTSLYWKSEAELLRHVVSIEKNYDTLAGMQLLMKYEDNLSEVHKRLENSNSPYSRSLWLRKLGIISRDHKDYQHSIAYLKEAIVANKFNAEAIAQLGVTYLQMGDVEQGIHWLKDSLMTDPHNPSVSRLLGTLYYQKGNFKFAKNHFEQSLYSDPDNLEVILYLSVCCLLNGEDQRYQQALDMAFERSKDTKWIIRFLAKELFRHSEFKKVIQMLKGSEELIGDDELGELLNMSYDLAGGKENKGHPAADKKGQQP